MFNLVFAKTYDFAIMMKNNLNHVIEDSFCVDNNIFCVADGITRELSSGRAFFYPTTIEEAKYIIANYPNPSGATLASQLCANNFVKYASELPQDSITENDILEIVKKINKDIKDLNKSKNKKIDYGFNDYFACVAVGGIIKENTLYCFAICDCKIYLLDENYNIVFNSASSSLSLIPYKDSFSFYKLFNLNWNWSNIKYRKRYRRVIRNNTKRLHQNKYTYGALTGEKSAIPFIKTYKIPLDNVKYILAFSDGCDDCLNSKEKIISVLENPEQIQNEIHEKTLLIYKRD